MSILASIYAGLTSAGESGSQSFSKHDYLNLVSSDVHAGWACSYYDSNYAEVADVSSLSSSSKKITWFNKKYVKGEGYWETLTDYTEDVPFYSYNTSCVEIKEILKNESNREVVRKECSTEKIPERTDVVAKTRWEPYNFDRNAKHLRFCANLLPVAGERNIDHVPEMFGHKFSEYAWWNSTMTKRAVYGRCPGCGSDMTVVIPLNTTYFGLKNVIWCNFTLPYSDNYSVVGFIYNDSNRVYCVDPYESSEVFTRTESGNGGDSGSYMNERSLLLWNPLNDSGRAYDYSIYKKFNTSAMTGTRTSVDGKVGRAVYFDGGAGKTKASIPYGDYDAASTGNFTFMAWINVNIDQNGGILTKMDGSGTSGFIWMYESNGDKIGLHFRDSSGWKTSFGNTSNLSLGAWYHVAVSYNGSHVRYYLNGKPDGVSAAMSGYVVPNNLNLRIGATDLSEGTDGNYYEMNGKIDNLMIWNRTLSAAEIMILYNTTSKATGDSGSIAYIGPIESYNENADEASGREAIETGINQALGSDSIIETDIYVWVAYKNGQHKNGTFDKVATVGNQTWAFNYLTGSDSVIGALNTTPVFYVWEKMNMIAANIQTDVYGLITTTKVSI